MLSQRVGQQDSHAYPLPAAVIIVFVAVKLPPLFQIINQKCPVQMAFLLPALLLFCQETATAVKQLFPVRQYPEFGKGSAFSPADFIPVFPRFLRQLPHPDPSIFPGEGHLAALAGDHRIFLRLRASRRHGKLQLLLAKNDPAGRPYGKKSRCPLQDPGEFLPAFKP